MPQRSAAVTPSPALPCQPEPGNTPLAALMGSVPPTLRPLAGSRCPARTLWPRGATPAQTGLQAGRQAGEERGRGAAGRGCSQLAACRMRRRHWCVRPPVTPSRMPMRMSALRGSCAYTWVPDLACCPCRPCCPCSCCSTVAPPPPPLSGRGTLAGSGLSACRRSRAYSSRHSSSNGFRWSGSGSRGGRSPSCSGASKPAGAWAGAGGERVRLAGRRVPQPRGLPPPCQPTCALVRLPVPPRRPAAVVGLGPRRPAQHLRAGRGGRGGRESCPLACPQQPMHAFIHRAVPRAARPHLACASAPTHPCPPTHPPIHPHLRLEFEAQRSAQRAQHALGVPHHIL